MFCHFLLLFVGTVLNLFEASFGFGGPSGIFRFKRQANPSEAPPTYPPYSGYYPGQPQQPLQQPYYGYGNGGYYYNGYPNYASYGNFYGYNPGQNGAYPGYGYAYGK